MNDRHSNVCYMIQGDIFTPLKHAKPFQNEFGLDLFQHQDFIYEGRTGLRLCSVQEAANLAALVERSGGVEALEKVIADRAQRSGLSPRYTRPDEKKKDVFPPRQRDENRVLAKDLLGKQHFYYRVYQEGGVELYTLGNRRDSSQTIYIPCDGFMVGAGQQNQMEEVLRWLSSLEHGIRGEIERVFNQSMALPDKWVNLSYAILLGKREEAEAHNAPLQEKYRQEDEQRAAMREAQARQRAQEWQDRYNAAIREAAQNILAGKTVVNQEINGKSLLMQLFREYGISVPLKTQGWIIHTLHSVRYSLETGRWTYQCPRGSRASTKLPALLPQLSAAIRDRIPSGGQSACEPDMAAAEGVTPAPAARGRTAKPEPYIAGFLAGDCH